MSRGGPALVIAGAGTGKTRTLIYRVAYLVECGILPHRIVLLTFTRRAARQMVDRAAALLDGRCRDVQGGTFHAFCLGVLRRHGRTIGIEPSFTVLDQSDSADVINVIRTNLGFHKHEERFPRKDTIVSILSAASNRCESVGAILEKEYPQFLGHLDRIRTVGATYASYKRDHALLDYDDLLQLTLQLLSENQSALTAVSSSCEHILVDEYQDTNRLQANLVEVLASVHRNVMVVGDDAQSIYRFRGADYRNLFEFEKRFEGTIRFTLEQNYRSSQQILDLANEVISQAHRKFDKRLFSRSKQADLPGLVPCPDERTESRFVAQMVLQLREEGVALNRSAVLFRSSHASYDLELELNRRQIPFVKYGGAKLTEAAHIKDVVAHLRVLENPSDAIAWNRILLLLEGLGPKSASDLISWITSIKDPLDSEPPHASSRFLDGLKRLFSVLQPLRDRTDRVGDDIEHLVCYYEPMLQRLYPDDTAKRLRDLEHFVGLARNASSRQSFLSELVLDPVELSAMEVKTRQQDESPLVLSTIHSAKGLEFDSVFIIQALEGSMPSAYSLNDDDAIDEELRLFYVAVTRAERNLFISYPAIRYRRGQGEYFADPSRFVTGIDESMLEKWELLSEPPQPFEHSPAALPPKSS